MDFSKLEEVQRWLHSKPLDWSEVLLARATLRVLPLAWKETAKWNEKTRTDLSRAFFMLAIFRTMAIPLLSVKTLALSVGGSSYISRSTDATVRLLADVTTAAVNGSTDFGTVAAGTIAAVAAGAFSFAHMVNSIRTAKISGDEFSAFAGPTSSAGPIAFIAGRAAAAYVGPATVASVFKTDCMVLENGAKPADLAGQWLWQATKQRKILSAWTKTKSDLLALDEDWDVWTRWYDALLEGREPESEAMAIARVSLSEKLWAQGPKAVNAEIKRLEKAEKQTKLDPTPRYHGNQAGLIQAGQQLQYVQVPTTTPPLWDYFISYSTHNEIEAREISEIIERTGHSTFAQFKDIAPGNNFVREMQRGLDGSGRVVALYSPHYEASNHCQTEWSAAYNVDPSGEDQKLVPFLIQPTSLNSLAACRTGFKNLAFSGIFAGLGA